jgi:ribosomal protein S18
VKGNPWKVIPFGDVLPGLFDEVKDSRPVVPERAVQTPHGQLFELGLAPKGSDAPTQRRAVLVNEQGKLLPRRLTGTSLKFQRKVAQAVKRARHLALMPYVADGLR